MLLTTTLISKSSTSGVCTWMNFILRSYFIAGTIKEDLYNLRSWTHGPLKKSPINPLTQINQSNKLKAQRRCALPFRASLAAFLLPPTQFACSPSGRRSRRHAGRRRARAPRPYVPGGLRAPRHSLGERIRCRGCPPAASPRRPLLGVLPASRQGLLLLLCYPVAWWALLPRIPQLCDPLFVIPLRRSRGLPGAAFRRTGRERAQLLANIFVFSTPGRLCSLLVTLLGVFLFWRGAVEVVDWLIRGACEGLRCLRGRRCSSVRRSVELVAGACDIRDGF